MIVKREHMSCTPGELKDGDILEKRVVTYVPPTNSMSVQTTTLIDVGIVVGEPWPAKGAWAVTVRNAFGEDEIRYFTNLEKSYVRRNTA